MPLLLDLPVELVAQILEEVGGRELRRGRGAERLLICRTWYHIAQPIFLSGLMTSEIDIRGWNLHHLDGRYSYRGQRHLMHKNTRSMSIRLLGHFWDENFASECEQLVRGENGWEEREDLKGHKIKLSDTERFQIYCGIIVA